MNGKVEKHPFVALPVASSSKTYDKHAHARHRRTQAPRAHSRQMRYISNSVFNGCSSEASLWCPSNFSLMFVWATQAARGLTQLFHGDRYANEQWRCRDLSWGRADDTAASHLDVTPQRGATACVLGSEIDTIQADTHTHRRTQSQRRLICSLLECSLSSGLTKRAADSQSKTQTHV